MALYIRRYQHGIVPELGERFGSAGSPFLGNEHHYVNHIALRTPGLVGSKAPGSLSGPVEWFLMGPNVGGPAVLAFIDWPKTMKNEGDTGAQVSWRILSSGASREMVSLQLDLSVYGINIVVRCSPILRPAIPSCHHSYLEGHVVYLQLVRRYPSDAGTRGGINLLRTPRDDASRDALQLNHHFCNTGYSFITACRTD
ncbi:hypothetical protein Bbelb_073980 [Branchiostoma belcheri]|nr:hypothetical protein Bbelb_073980 [Branchiostoma belcheri]